MIRRLIARYTAWRADRAYWAGPLFDEPNLDYELSDV